MIPSQMSCSFAQKNLCADALRELPWQLLCLDMCVFGPCGSQQAGEYLGADAAAGWILLK